MKREHTQAVAQESQGMTRRGFMGAALAGTMGVAAASLLAGCGAPAAEGAKGSDGDAAWDQEADVVVIGGGAGGHAAAIEAANAGASVILLEKASAVGGDSALCDGILGGYGTKLATAQGIDVTADDMYEWFMAHPEWYGPKDPAVTRVNAEKSGETIDWLQDQGVPFEETVAPRFGYTELPVIHQVDGRGAEMMRVLGEVAASAGVTTLTDAPAAALVTATEGRVVGVRAKQGSSELRVQAKKGVVLACGGYSGSNSMLATLNAECANLMAGSSPSLTGDGLAMAMQIGAYATRISDLPLMSSLAGLEYNAIVNVNYAERLHGLWLDANGERFFDEETEYENPLGHRAILRKQNEQGSPVVLLLPTTPELEAVLATRPLEWAKADTVEEVAQMVGLDGAKVKATVDRYNGFCEAGRDDDFGRPAEFLVPMTGPFYASTIMVSTSVTTGGVKTNDKAQVLRLLVDDKGASTEPIPGLYAAGVVCEWNCAAGCTVLSAMTLGRIAGQNVAAG